MASPIKGGAARLKQIADQKKGKIEQVESKKKKPKKK
jgi:hypothetical protein